MKHVIQQDAVDIDLDILRYGTVAGDFEDGIFVGFKQLNYPAFHDIHLYALLHLIFHLGQIDNTLIIQVPGVAGPKGSIRQGHIGWLPAQDDELNELLNAYPGVKKMPENSGAIPHELQRNRIGPVDPVIMLTSGKL